jgi:DNA-binding transcriptional LysR family regulator
METGLAHLKFRHYQLIHAIAELGQLSLAAEHLAMTQPGASRLLAEVERTVGQPLFERQPKGMVATRMGEVVRRHAGALLDRLAETTREVDAFRAGRSGTVRVGAVTGAAVAYVVPAIQALKHDARDAEIHVDVAPSIALMPKLLTGEYDFVLSRVPPEFDARMFEILRGRVEEVEFLMRADHPLLWRGAVPLEALADYGWVIQAPGTPMREAVEGALLSRGIAPPREIINTPSLLVMIAYLRTSDAISPISREVAELVRGAVAGGLQTVRLTGSIIIAPYHLIRVRDRPTSPLAQRLLDLVLANLSRL